MSLCNQGEGNPNILIEFVETSLIIKPTKKHTQIKQFEEQLNYT